MRITLIACAFAIALFDVRAQEPEVLTGPDWSPEKTTRKKELRSDAAWIRVAAFKKDYKSKEVAKRVRAILTLVESGPHGSMVKPLSAALKKDRSPDVREVAARALGELGYLKAETTLRKALADKRNRKRNASAIRENLAEAMGLVARSSFVERFKNDFRNGTDRYVLRGLIVGVGHMRDDKAGEYLANWVERPAPGNVNSAGNPPASYWKARFETWEYVSDAAQWALWRISGQVFTEKKQVKAWLKTRRNRKTKR